MNLKNAILTFALVFIINACNEQEISKVETTQSELEVDLKKLGEAFRFGARLEYAAARTNGFTSDPAEIEKGMIEYLRNEYGDGMDEAAREMKSTEAYQYVSEAMDQLDTRFADSDGKLVKDAELRLSQELAVFEGVFNFVDVSQSFKDYIHNINVRLTDVTHDYLIEIEKHAELIDGEYHVSREKVNEEDHINKLKSEIGAIEDEIVANARLNDEEKQILFNYTTSMLINADNITDFAVAKYATADIGSGRIELFGLCSTIFTSVVTVVVSVVVTGLFTAMGIIYGLAVGNIPGAIIGGLVGFGIGLQFSSYLSCQWFLTAANCQACQNQYPDTDFNC